MTREEAKEILTHNWTRVDNPNYTESELDEAIDMAIEALSVTQTDLINRGRADAIEAIQNAYCKPCKERGDDHNEVRCRVCEYDNAIIQIDALPSAEARWIPCSERLPSEDGGEYLVTDYCPQINRRRIRIAYCYANKLGFWSDTPKGYEVLAWMPLPEPYREDGEV